MKNQLSSSRITEGVIWKQLLLFFFPILMGSFFQQMYNTVDTIIVGRAIGTQALAAVGSSASLINLLNGFFIGLSSGATVVLSQYYGASDRDGVSKALHTGMLLSLILGAVAMTIGIVLGPAVMKLIRTPENCLKDASTYVQIYFSGAVFSMIYNMGTGILRAMGDSRKPMIFLIISCLVNILMDILCVVILKLGVAGAAIATVIAQGFSAVLVLITLTRLPQEHLDWAKLRMDSSILGRILLIGLPAGLQFVTFDLSNILTQSTVNSFGSATVAAFTAYCKSDAIIWMVCGAFGVAITTFVGQNYGAGKILRVHRSIWICLGMSTGVIGSLSIAEILFREWILKIYTTDREVIRLGTYMMLCTVPYCVLFLPVEILGGAMRGTGYSLVPTLITSFFVCTFRILWIFTAVVRWHTLTVLLMCYPISWLISSAAFFVTYFRKKWLNGKNDSKASPYAP